MLTNPSEDCAVVTVCVGLGKHLGPGNLSGRLGAVYVTHADQQMHRGGASHVLCLRFLRFFVPFFVSLVRKNQGTLHGIIHFTLL